MKDLKVLLLLLPFITTTTLFASDDINGAFILIAFIIILFIILIILFINSQNNLIDVLAVEDRSARTSKFWTWSQIVPIWSVIAQIVAIIKITNQYHAFVRENSIFYGEIDEYQPIWGWLYIGFGLASLFFKPFAVIAFIFFIMYWINISRTTKSVMRFLNMQESLELGGRGGLSISRA